MRETLFPTDSALHDLPIHVDSHARDWLNDLAWADEEDATERIATLNPVQLKAAINRHYEGGWRGFLVDEGEIDPR